jgi:hypothetical protein
MEGPPSRGRGRRDDVERTRFAVLVAGAVAFLLAFSSAVHTSCV